MNRLKGLKIEVPITQSAASAATTIPDNSKSQIVAMAERVARRDINSPRTATKEMKDHHVHTAMALYSAAVAIDNVTLMTRYVDKDKD